MPNWLECRIAARLTVQFGQVVTSMALVVERDAPTPRPRHAAACRGQAVLGAEECLVEDPSAGRVIAGLLEPHDEELGAVAKDAFCMLPRQPCAFRLRLCGSDQLVGVSAVGRQDGCIAVQGKPPRLRRLFCTGFNYIGIRFKDLKYLLIFTAISPNIVLTREDVSRLSQHRGRITVIRPYSPTTSFGSPAMKWFSRPICSSSQNLRERELPAEIPWGAQRPARAPETTARFVAERRGPPHYARLRVLSMGSAEAKSGQGAQVAASWAG